ncbi:tetratricopeptide repeat domain protein [Beauveria bassiana ARSEF 2860]|uniref:Tetratricopeptide repeat domain protein n=1 Tax=Beauveria bassiana (strain ARSEF 2860) TaxID=655819 RepID=J4VQ52_BEAB2|nr:tetratricopeptide repeat domain protein [Beauveria bassiana ARSEF 2860]EJP60820.1 tetratricopeptide repeat domain protein [Beauveria bassiana ARSEF 2860]
MHDAATASQMDYFKTVVDLTGIEQLCFNCRALLDDGPKHRIHGHLLCNECADIVSLLRVHNWRVCLVCALAGEADDIDCADIQNFLDRPKLKRKLGSTGQDSQVARAGLASRMSPRRADIHTGSTGNAPRAIQSTPGTFLSWKAVGKQRGRAAYASNHSLFLRLVHDQLAIYREQRNDAAIEELHSTVVGAVYAKRQKMKQAAAILVRAMVGFQRQSGERDVRAFNLGGVHQDRGKLSHTIRTYHGAAHGFREIMAFYKTTITAFTQLAALCSARRAFPEAEKAYTLALQGLGEAARQDSIDALILKLDLGISYRDVKRLEFAEKLIEEGRAEEAEASFADAAKESAVCDEEYSAMSYAASFGLGNLLRSQRRLAEAEAMYRQAWMARGRSEGRVTPHPVPSPTR